ncbi:MAG: hypothetical protein AB1791_00420 [Chloroflexota bacterium]
MTQVKKRRPYWIGLALFLVALLALAGLTSRGAGAALAGPAAPGVTGPFSGQSVAPYVFNGDLRDLAQTEGGEPRIPFPLRYVPGTEPKGSAPQIAGWTDALAQTEEGAGQMPPPIANFAGMSLAAGGAGWPPDTNGDVGPNHYMQTVNTSIAVYDKDSGAELVRLTFDDFFNGTGTICDDYNYGDPVVVYDRLADRWLVTDFAFTGSGTTPPYYECMAVSQTGDPVSGGWYMYGMLISNTALDDYPKVAVWPDGYYVTFNMFIAPNFDWGGVDVWAFNRDDMLAGLPADNVHFNLGPETGYGSLLASHMLSEPPAGSPNYVASVGPPDQFQVWEFDVDWANPGNSTLTGPTVLPIADFAIAQSIPQPGTFTVLDSLSFRPMMQNIYREVDGVESIWLNHTVASTDGYGGVRWYEVQDPGGAPVLAQEGTYQPDDNHRWMGSLAVDQDGNMAVGYSVGDSDLYASIRYAGRLYGEIPGLLPQAEEELIAGTGAQTTISRWGDYSAMAVDPNDDCTFWYTTEYYITTGTNWQTRIGSFKFPSCGQPKGTLTGVVRNSVTLEPVPGAMVVAAGPEMTLTAETDANGVYTMALLGDSYDVTGGPLLPGYPVSNTISGVVVNDGSTTIQDILLDPVPHFVEGSNLVDDNVALGNGNGYPEPGEQGLLFWEGLLNDGAITATNVTAELVSLTDGLTIDVANASYPDVGAGQTMTNTTAYSFSISPNVACGSNLDFEKTVTADQGTYTVNFSLNASVPQPRADVFFNDVEGGAAGWTHAGSGDTWDITDASSHSPTHSWTDSPSGDYANNVNSYLRSPAYNLSGKTGVQLTAWYKYALEAGYDYVYIDYSLDGGLNWSTDAEALYVFNAFQDEWTELTVDASVLDNQANVAIRYRIVTDPGVIEDGFYVDDIQLSYQPIACDYVAPGLPSAPTLVSPPDGSTAASDQVTFVWQDSGAGDPPDGYIFTLDGADVLTFTSPVTSTTMSLEAGAHTWSVTAYNVVGNSAPSETWTINVPSTSIVLCSTPNLAIPDFNNVGVIDTIVVTQTGVISDVNLYVNTEHTFVGDLVFTLQQVSTSFTAKVIDRPGAPASTFGCSGDNIDAWLDDEATDPVEDECAASIPAILGDFTPNEPLNTFDGQEVNGVWGLRVKDIVSDNTGTLVEWCVEIKVPAPEPVEYRAYLPMVQHPAAGGLGQPQAQPARPDRQSAVPLPVFGFALGVIGTGLFVSRKRRDL